MALILRVQYINLILLHYQKCDCNFTPFHKQQNTEATLKGQKKCIKLPQIYSRYDQPKPHESRESCLGMVRARSTEGSTAHTHARASTHSERRSRRRDRTLAGTDCLLSAGRNADRAAGRRRGAGERVRVNPCASKNGQYTLSLI